MNVLISGGTGLIGRTLSESLIEDGHKVTVLTRNPQKAAQILPSGAIPHYWDAQSLDGWAHLAEESDAIVNLAGQSIGGESLGAIFTQKWTPTQKEKILNSRLNAGQAITSAIQAASHKPKVLIQASAVGYYGPRSMDEISEDDHPGNDYLSKVCQQWEDSTAEVEKLGVRRVVIRTGLVLSQNGGILPVMLLPFKLFAGGPVGSGEQDISWISLADEINAIRFLIDNDEAEGAFNLSAPHPVNYKEFAKIAGKVLKRPGFIPTPAFALKVALGEKSTLVLDGQRVIPKKLQALGFEFQHRDLHNTLREEIS